MKPEVTESALIHHNVITQIFERLLYFVFGGGISYEAVAAFLFTLWTVYSVLAFLLSAAIILGIIYSYIKISEYDEIASKRLLDEERKWAELYDGSIEDERWAGVQKHLASDNPNDWKLAIIEADVLLDRMLDKAGYTGTTIGDKLKNASTRSFTTLDDAWQAHRVRNQIAHGGADFVLTHKVAQETLIQYERVFREFSFI